MNQMYVMGPQMVGNHEHGAYSGKINVVMCRETLEYINKTLGRRRLFPR